jgi:hypothetical protein
MSGHKRVSTPSPAKPSREPQQSAGSDSPSGLTPEQIRRWASLVADGTSEFPGDLAPVDRDRLLVATRRLLRERLVRLVARAIAIDIRRGLGQRKEAEPNA